MTAPTESATTAAAIQYELSQTFTFDAAHTLTRTVPLAEFEWSRRIHGHTYTACVAVRGIKGADGMLVDLFYLRQAIETVRGKLDHRFLDEVEGLGAATLENLCTFIFNHLKDQFPVLNVSVARASGDACTLRVA